MLRSNTSSWTRVHPWSRRPAHQARRQARRASGRSIGRNCDWLPSLASPARSCANHRGHAPRAAAAPDLERSEGRRRNAPRAGSGVDIRSVARTTAYRRRRARPRNGKAAPLAGRHQSCSAPCSNEAAPADQPLRQTPARCPRIAAAPPRLSQAAGQFGAPSQRTMGGRFDCDPSSIGRTPKNISSPTITSA